MGKIRSEIFIPRLARLHCTIKGELRRSLVGERQIVFRREIF